jgi:hypothetical protein
MNLAGIYNSPLKPLSSTDGSSASNSAAVSAGSLPRKPASWRLPRQRFPRLHRADLTGVKSFKAFDERCGMRWRF